MDIPAVSGCSLCWIFWRWCPVSGRHNEGERNRKYGRKHREARARALTVFVDGQACVRCGEGMYTGQALDLDHDDDGVTYRGLAHASCNRSAGGRNGALAVNAGPVVPTRLCELCRNPMCRRPLGAVSRCWFPAVVS